MFGKKNNDGSDQGATESTGPIKAHTMSADVEMAKEGKLPVDDSPAPQAAASTQSSQERKPQVQNPFGESPAPQKPQQMTKAPAPQGTPFVKDTPQPEAPQQPTPEPSISIKNSAPEQVVSEKPMESTPPQDIPSDGDESHAVRTFVIALLVLITVGAAAGGGYFYLTQDQEMEIADDPFVEPVVEEPVVVEEPQPLYTTDVPNPIIVDPQTATKENLTQEFLLIAQNVQNEPTIGAIPFALTDTEQFPVTFSTFAALYELNIPQQVLTTLGDDFLLYFYNDAGNVRMGLSVLALSPESLGTTMEQNESFLVDGFAPLYLIEPFAASTEFSSSVYGETDIRYVNINDLNTLSLDYAVFEGELVVGTSKDSLRAILDAKTLPFGVTGDAMIDDGAMMMEDGTADGAMIEDPNGSIPINEFMEEEPAEAEPPVQ